MLEPLQGSDFYLYLKKYPLIDSRCKGIYSIDKVPKCLKFREFIICNTSPSSHPSGHWFAILQNSHFSENLKIKPKNKFVEIFDSGGVTDEKLELYKRYCPFWKIEFNKTQFQSNSTSSCGHFVLYYVINRMNNLDLEFEDFIETFFEENIETNEKIIFDFFFNLVKQS